MARTSKLILIRLLPVLFITVVAVAYIFDVQGPDTHFLRNIVPVIVLVGLSALALYCGAGSWIGAGWGWPLGTLGFAIPALGLSLYLHYHYSASPGELFRYLPIFTVVAGGIGFAIGWIVGRNV